MTQAQRSTDARKAADGADSRLVLHTGDLVLLKVQLNVNDRYAEAIEEPENTGYIRSHTTGQGIELTVEPITEFRRIGVEIRDYLFTVIDNMSYNAQKDYLRKKKHLAQQLGDHAAGNVSSYKQLARYEERARQEAQENFERIHSKHQKPIKYGQVIQLQHLRTERFICVRAKMPATLHRVARKIELEPGCAASLLRIQPFFRHVNQGDPVMLTEQVEIESMKLGNRWNINWSSCHNTANDEVYEVNFAKGGRGVYLMLYSRGTAVGASGVEVGLSFSTPLRLFSPHNSGYLCASTSHKKANAYMRKQGKHEEHNAKDVWIIEPAYQGEDHMIVYGTTKVLLRHFASGRYLAIKGADEVFTASKMLTLNSGISFRDAEDEFGGVQYCSAALVLSPDTNCHMVMEPTQSLADGEHATVPLRPCSFMLRWAHPQRRNLGMWFSVMHREKKGRRQSLHVGFVLQKFSRDALRFEVLAHDEWMAECDVVAEHKTNLVERITPRCKEFGDRRVAVTVCAHCELALTDMLLFLADSPFWRAESEYNRQPDPLQTSWAAHPKRQILVRELKYIDASFELFHEMVKQTPRLVESNSHTLWRAALMSLSVDAEMQQGNAAAMGDQSNELLLALQTRCLKLIVRVWLYCFLGCEENENYFLRRGWLETIDRLNGHGLGAADVFVSLAGSSAGMARQIREESFHKFVEFIRSLGPLDTWLNFLRVVCAPQCVALAIKQQEVCVALVCAGMRSSAEERARAQRNRDALLVAVKLGAPLGRSLGMPIGGATPPQLDQCLARDLLVEGTKELAISWTYSDNWTHGQGTLYHSPSALGLTPATSGQPHARIWVSLAQVVWVLQPERCCHAATGRAWEDVKSEFEGIEQTARNKVTVPDTAVPASASRIERLITLAKYFLAQLKLVSAMCKGKQMNCILAVQEDYPMSVCICGASDPRLPTSIRSAFYDLITDLYVDRRPHSTIMVPALMRCLPESGSVPHDALPAFHMPAPHEPDAWSDQHRASLPAEIHEFYSLCRPEKLEAVMWSLRQYFSAGPDVEQQVHSNEDDNALMVSVLRLMHFLIQYGFISSLPLLRELIGPLLRCLDGRIDFVDPATNPVSIDTGAAAEDDNMKCDPSEPLLPRVNGSACLDETGPTLTGARFPALDEHTQRWVNCPENQGVVKTKISMLEVLTAFMSIDMHVKMSRALELFRAYRGTNLFDDVPQKVVRILAEPDVPISQPRIRAPSVMLIDLLMYEDSELFSAALKFLFNVHGQTAELMDKLSRVELLTPAQVSLYSELQMDVNSIGQIIHSYENWGADDAFSSIDQSVYVSLQGKCNKIRRLCKEGAPKFSTSAFEVQKMLRETEYFPLLFFVLNTNCLDFHPSSREMYRQVTRDMCSVSASVVAHNPKSQLVAFAALDALRGLVADGNAEAALMISAIFRGNDDLCKRVPDDLITLFGELMAKGRRAGRFNPWYITFFPAIVNVGLQAITHNQIKTMNMISNSDGVLHLLPGAPGRDRLLLLASKFQSAHMLLDPDVRSWTEGDDAELVYYAHSVELLLGLSISYGNQMLLNKPFVTSHMSVPHLVDMLMSIDFPERQTNDSNTGFSIYRHLRTRYLQLLNMVFYSVDNTHINEDFLASSLHMELLRKFLLWAGKILRMPEDAAALRSLAVPAPRPRGGNQAAQMITAEEEAHLHAILDCIDDCFNGPHLGILREGFEDVIGTINAILEDYRLRFEWLVKVMKTPDCQQILGVQDIEHLKLTVHRILTATSCGPGAEDQPPVPAKAKSTTGRRVASSIYEAEWNAMMERMVNSDVIKSSMVEDEELIGAYISNIAHLTDPQLATYRIDLPKDRLKGLPDGVDFRRGIITTEDVLRRFVKHCNDHLHSDVQIVTLIQKTLRALLVIARRSTEQAALVKTQATFVKSGIMGLIVKILNARLTAQCTNASWTLLAMALQGNDEHQMVNKEAQKGLYDACVNGDDSGMWVSFAEAVSNVCNEVKMVRTLQKLDSNTEEEMQQLEEYEGHVATVVKAMQAARLMVEGHYFPMQQYLFAQVGKSRSCNVAGEVARLMIRICKDPLSAELASEGEFNCVSEALTVLTELTQGPNLRTQEYLCTVGVVENVAKLLASDFDRQCRAADDLYPAFVRRLKVQLVEGLLALLEGRMDSKNHIAIIERMDPHILKERIEFVYLYFVFGSATVSSGTISPAGDTPAAVPLDHPVCSLVTNADEDASRVWDELQMATGVAEELLEDLEDRELNEFFGEGLRVLEMIRILGPHSATFESSVLPNPQILAWADERERYPTEREYLEQRKVHYSEVLYKHAFNFLSRFVLTIEVLLSGQLQCLHFQQPLTALWYVPGAAKQHILDSVPFSSPDVKMKAFVAMCSKLHGESKLIRDLSRFSIVPKRCLKTARRYLPDSAHRPFQVFLANDAFWMQRMLSMQLFVGLALASHTGVFLRPGAKGGETVWISPLASQVANTLGAMYLAIATLWVFLTICIRVPLNLRRSKGRNRLVVIAKTILLDSSLLWRAVLMLVSGSALLLSHAWLYSFLLMDFFSQSLTLFTVLKAVGTPVQSLMMTFLGTVIVTFVYASVGYHYFMDDYGEYCSEDIMTCTVNILYQATRNGVVGLSSMMAVVMPGNRRWMARVAYDMSYFIVLGIMILNTIVGIIVDSFSQLRQEAMARQEMHESQTFVSCIHKKTIDAAANGQGIAEGFAHHETHKQPKWAYMAFVFYLREKNLQDYTGPEQIISHMIEEEDVTWLPIGRSKMSEEDESSASRQEDIMVRIEKHLDVLVRGLSKSTDEHKRLQGSFAGLQRGIKEQLANLMSAVESVPQLQQGAAPSEEIPAKTPPSSPTGQRAMRYGGLFS